MPNDAEPDLGSLSYLIVEDEEFSRAVIRKNLEKIGASKITTASNGIEALAQLQSPEPPPDVIFIDIIMPEMGGVELLRHLGDGGFKGAVALVSAAGEETLAVAEGMAKYRDLNVLGFITKPVTPQSLTEILGKLG
ncbi:MAG: response regulator [Proteobacteria bacterium]|nr:response regulator [Pseudomonadota bacterium]